MHKITPVYRRQKAISAWKFCRRLMFGSLLAVLIVFLNGCVSGPSYPPPSPLPPVPNPDTSDAGEAVEQQPPTKQQIPGDTREENPSRRILPTIRESAAPPAAVLSLVQEGWTLYREGRWQEAIATAERGLRIQRRVAELYLLLAHAYLALDDPDQARAFAHQGLRYSRNGSVTEQLQTLLSSFN